MIEVQSSGLFSSMQDLGRIGYRKFGVPISGAMDLQAAKLANQILGNTDNAPVLEMTIIGPTLKFLKACRFVITGADFQATLDSRFIELNTIVTIKAGQELKFRSARLGVRGYLAIENGFDSPVVLGSVSFYKNITIKEKLEKGDVLMFNSQSKNPITNRAVTWPLPDLDTQIIDVLKGPEFDMLSAFVKEKLTSRSFTISTQSNRMGFRLEIDESLTAQEIITTPVQPGTVQLTPSGQLIILGRDAQTTGGYARVLQLTEASQNILAQKQFKSSIYFKIR